VYSENKGSINWDLTTLNPPFVSQSAIILINRLTSFYRSSEYVPRCTAGATTSTNIFSLYFMRSESQRISIHQHLNGSMSSTRTPRTTKRSLPVSTPGSMYEMLPKLMSSLWRSQRLVESVSFSQLVSSDYSSPRYHTQPFTHLEI